MSILLAGFLVGIAPASPPVQQPYVWKDVQMVGGGFVDGIVCHPTVKGLRYARTDMGGAYRWDDRVKRWISLLDWIPYDDLNLVGVESIAVDPHDPDRVYLACGTYTNATTPDGAILRSGDRGKTFQMTRVPFKFGGNENGRGNGERMMVDPNDGRVILLGTRHNGLWKSTDAGVTWNRVENFPMPASLASRGSAGIVGVMFDPTSGTLGKPSSTVYVSASALGEASIYRSRDGGATWTAVEGQPTKWVPTHMILASDGTLYISYGSSPGPSAMRDGAVRKLNTRTGEWADITPDKPDAAQNRNFGYAAISVQASDPKVLIASTHYHPIGEEIFRSTDAGKTWRPVFGEGRAIYDFKLAPYVARTPIHWMFDIEIDPFNPNHAMFTTGYGGYETFDLGNVEISRGPVKGGSGQLSGSGAQVGKPAPLGKPTPRETSTHWSVMSTGIEETVPLVMISPREGAPLMSAIGDYGGFVHWNLDKPALDGNFDHPHFGNTTGLAVATVKPSVIVRVGTPSGNRGGGSIGYSLDFGKTWQPAASLPRAGAVAGHVSVSTDGTTWIWSLRGGAFLTRDLGATWTACEGLPANPRVIADQNASNRFYDLDLFEGKIYVSEDGGAHFTAQSFRLTGGLPAPGGDRGDGRGGQDQLYSTPDKPGDFWLTPVEGLHHSSDGGKTFAKIPEVRDIRGFGFGKAAPHSTYPALYLMATIAGQPGIFRSDDAGQHWVRINDDPHQWGLVLQITGDSRVYGRVYVGAHGRGIRYGDPEGRR